MVGHYSRAPETQSCQPFERSPGLTVRCAMPAAPAHAMPTRISYPTSVKQYSSSDLSGIANALPRVHSQSAPDQQIARSTPGSLISKHDRFLKAGSGLEVLGDDLRHDARAQIGRLDPLLRPSENLMVSLDSCLPDAYKVPRGLPRHPRLFSVIRAAAIYAYEMASPDTKPTTMPPVDTEEDACEALAGLVPAEHFNLGDPNVLWTIVSAAKRYFRSCSSHVAQATPVPIQTQMDDTPDCHAR